MSSVTWMEMEEWLNHWCFCWWSCKWKVHVCAVVNWWACDSDANNAAHSGARGTGEQGSEFTSLQSGKFRLFLHHPLWSQNTGAWIVGEHCIISGKGISFCKSPGKSQANLSGLSLQANSSRLSPGRSVQAVSPGWTQVLPLAWKVLW